jgi:hypothetical protein
MIAKNKGNVVNFSQEVKMRDNYIQIQNKNKNRVTSFLRIKGDCTENKLYKITDEITENNILKNAITLLTNKEGKDKFLFDGIFEGNTTPMEIFKETCLNTVFSLFEDKRSSLILCHGLKGTGKSSTMIGTTKNPGIIPFALGILNDRMTEKRHQNIKVFCNYFDLYDNETFDLIHPEGKKLIKSSRGSHGKISFLF